MVASWRSWQDPIPLFSCACACAYACAEICLRLTKEIERFSFPLCFFSRGAEQREIRAQPAALLSVGSLHAALRWASDGLEPPDSPLPAVSTARLDLEAPSGAFSMLRLRPLHFAFLDALSGSL